MNRSDFSSAAVAAAGPRTCELLPVALTTLSASPSLCVDLYIKRADGQPPVLYRQRRFPVSPRDFDRLISQGIRVGYMPASQLDQYQHYLRENLDEHLAKDDIAPARRYEFLSAVGRDLLAECSRTENVDTLVRTSAKLGNQMVNLISNHDMATWDLFCILRHDYRTYTHAFNVASYCLLLAKGLGIRGENELRELGLGGLLHDTGKLQIPAAILEKRGPLNEAEREIVNRHPTSGFKQLSDRGDVSWSQLMMVYQHHERLDGSGYPVGHTANDIHRSARICTVADVFEALTSRRPYRKPVLISEALDYLNHNVGRRFDKEIVQCWTELISDRP